MKYLEDPSDYISEDDRTRLHNVFGFPDQSEKLPPGWRGWLVLHYRKRGLNILERSEHVKAEVGFLYGRFAYDGLERLYAAILKSRTTDEEYRAANDNRPNLIKDRDRLTKILVDPEHREGWFSTWWPPRFGPQKVSPFAHFSSKQPRIHSRLMTEDMADLFQKRRLFITRFS